MGQILATSEIRMWGDESLWNEFTVKRKVLYHAFPQGDRSAQCIRPVLHYPELRCLRFVHAKLSGRALGLDNEDGFEMVSADCGRRKSGNAKSYAAQSVSEANSETGSKLRAHLPPQTTARPLIFPSALVCPTLRRSSFMVNLGTKTVLRMIFPSRSREMSTPNNVATAVQFFDRREGGDTSHESVDDDIGALGGRVFVVWGYRSMLL